MAFARLNRHALLDSKYFSETKCPCIVHSLAGFGTPAIKKRKHLIGKGKGLKHNMENKENKENKSIRIIGEAGSTYK